MYQDYIAGHGVHHGANSIPEVEQGTIFHSTILTNPCLNPKVEYAVAKIISHDFFLLCLLFCNNYLQHIDKWYPSSG